MNQWWIVLLKYVAISAFVVDFWLVYHNLPIYPKYLDTSLPYKMA